MRPLPLALLFLLACSSSASDEEGDVVRYSPAASPLVADVPLAPFDAAAVAQARDACSLESGDVDPPTSGEDLAHKLTGAWLQCAPSTGGFRAMQLMTNGQFAVLEDDGAGGLVAARGFERTGHWELRGYSKQLERSAAPDALWYLDLYCGSCGASGSPVLEKNPRRLIGHRWGGMGTWSPIR
ncbi:hypothetical protein [Labilithrix luteola]|nr:hypothetical protein [Labilithrix luteola]